MKRKAKNQQTIFDWLRKAEALSRQTPATGDGSLDIDAEFRGAVSADIKACPLSRYQIAARMSELAGQEITESMLYSWTAEAKHRHRFPCQFIPAFTVATGGRRAVEAIGRRAGLFILPGVEALRAEIQKLDEEINSLKKEKQKRSIFLKEINGG